MGRVENDLSKGGGSLIRLEKLALRAGGFQLDNLNLEIPTGHYAVLMGRTGSGKTTLLEAICGLRAVAGGSIQLMDREVTQLKPAQRGIGYVPQDRALFPTLTVREHLAFALVIRRWNRAAIATRVNELAELLGILPLLARLPQRLSGGEAQRVALGRALAARPDILCLDEPLSALDEETRLEMYALLEKLQKQTGVTTLHVTHHPGETERLAGLIFLLKNGQLTRVK